MGAPDNVINPVKPLADARGRDLATNDGYALGAVALHRDSIVGTEYRLNSQPNFRLLEASDGWAEEFQAVAEARFHAIAESPACWLDASRRLTLTEIVRMAVGSFVMSGEFCAAAEWITDQSRPLRTAIQLVSPDRLDNPRGIADSATMRRGVELNRRGQPIAYHVRLSHPNDTSTLEDRYR
jgi:capsid protein